MEVEKDVPYWPLFSRNSQLLAFLGFIFVFQKLKIICSVIIWFIRVYSPSIYRPYKYLHKYGQWAAITGCTSGIGLALAKQFARRGINVVLISRNKDKLQSLANEIQTKFKVEVKIFLNDAVNRQDTIEVAKQLSQLDIGILVNNVGLNYTENLHYIHELSRDDIIEMMTVNTGHSVVLMKHILPNMIRARKGCVINICSGGSYFPLPLQQLYSSTKVYLDVLTKAIGIEMSTYGVTMQSICPLIVQSNMTLTAHDLVHKFLSVPAPSYANSVLNIVGTSDSVSGYWLFDLLMALYNILLYETILAHLIYCGTIMIKVGKKWK